MEALREPVVIEVGLNEAVSRQQHPAVPNAPDEIVADILACARAGASIVHFHARDPTTGEQRCGDEALYRRVMAEVRAAGCDVMLYPTYEPFISDFERARSERFGHVLALADDPDLDVGIVPLDMGSVDFVWEEGGELSPINEALPLDRSIYRNPFRTLVEMLREYDARDLIVSLAVFEPGHLRSSLALVRAGLPRHPVVKFFLSGHWLHGLLPEPESVHIYARMIERLAARRRLAWFCAPTGLDSREAVDELLRCAIAAGGHVRVGIGDTPVAAGGRCNAELVAEAARLAAELGRDVAPPAEARRLLRAS